MEVILTWVAGGFGGERAPERAEKLRGEWGKSTLYNYPVPGVQIVGTAGRDVNRKNSDGAGKGVRVNLPHLHLLIFVPLSYFCAALHYLNAWNRLLHKQTASYTGFPRTRLSKLKNSVLVLEIAINTETYVTTSTTMLNSFHTVYIHLLKCPPQTHCHFHCSPLFSLQDGVTFISPVALTEPLTTAPVLRKLVFT